MPGGLSTASESVASETRPAGRRVPADRSAYGRVAARTATTCCPAWDPPRPQWGVTQANVDQRPRFERLIRRVAAEGLEPYGFQREAGRLWTRPVGPDVTHCVEWQKGKWTRSTTVSFYVNLDAFWVSGPNTAWPEAPEPRPAHVVGSRLRITDDDPDFDMVTEASGQSNEARRDLFRLMSDVSEDAAATVLLRVLAQQGRPELDRVVDADSCIQELREPDASIPGAEAFDAVLR